MRRFTILALLASAVVPAEQVRNADSLLSSTSSTSAECLTSGEFCASSYRGWCAEFAT